MQTIAEIRELLRQYGIHPKKRFGQNFLHDQNQARKLLEAADVQPGAVVLEVGPGTGMLTDALLAAHAEVICCEIDEGLATLLADRFGERITLIRGDVLEKGRALSKQVVRAIDGRAFKLVANLPYQIASPLMAELVINHPNCAGQFVTIQKEVADRLLAQPGRDAYGPLGIIIQTFAQVQRIGTVPPACFWPQPKVTSAMIAVLPEAAPDEVASATEEDAGLRIDDRRDYARFITQLFTKRRKQLGAVFGRDAAFPEGIDPNDRPEKLSIERFSALFNALGNRHSRP